MKNKKALPASYVVCMYVRLSIEDSDTGPGKKESNSITAQRQLIQDFIKSHTEFSACKVIERCDDGFSGTHFDTRPECTEMIEMAKRGEINCIIVKDFSRFGRNYVELGDYLEQLFPFLGVRFISVNDGYDSDDLKDGETAGLSVAFQNLIYDYYSKELSAKVKASCRQRAEHGMFNASYAPFGYRKMAGNKRKLEINPDEAPVVKEIFDMKLGGMKLADIARNLNDRHVPCPIIRLMERSNLSEWIGVRDGFVWTASGINHILRNEEYTGMLVAQKSTVIEPGGKTKRCAKEDWIKVADTHEAIVSRDVFDQVQKSLNNVKHKPSKRRNIFRCGYCGRILSDQSRMVGSMRCYRGKVSNDVACLNVILNNRKAKDCVLKMVQQKIRVYMDAEERRKAGREELDPDDMIASLQSAIESEKRAWMKMYDEYSDGKLGREEFILHKGKYDEAIEQLKAKLEEMEKQKREANRAERIGDVDFEPVLEAKELTQEIMDTFIDHVDVFENERIDIHWRFDNE